MNSQFLGGQCWLAMGFFFLWYKFSQCAKFKLSTKHRIGKRCMSISGSQPHELAPAYHSSRICVTSWCLQKQSPKQAVGLWMRLRMWARGWVFMLVCILLTSALGSITYCWLSYSKRYFSLPESCQLYPLTFSLEGNISSSQVHRKLLTTAGDLALVPLCCALTSWLRHLPPGMTVSLVWQPPTLHGLRLHEILFFH